MKVDRIVGQERGESIQDILQYRQQFYENSYDVRVVCEPKESVESVTSKVIEALNRFKHNSGHRSTRDVSKKDEAKSFNDIVIEGLAKDGGLFIPTSPIPKFSLNQWTRFVGLTYQDLALRILEKWIHPNDIKPEKLRQMISLAYSVDSFSSDDVVPVQHLSGNQYVSELFHGPTASFKDLALQLMPHFFLNAMKTSSQRSLGYSIEKWLSFRKRMKQNVFKRMW